MRPIITLVTALLLVTACATATGPGAFDRFDRVDLRAPAARIAAYDRVYLAPISASPALLERIGQRRIGPVRGTDEGFEIGQDTLIAKLEDFQGELVEALGAVVTLEDAPGPGVLTITVVVDDLASNRPTIEALGRQPGLDARSFSVGDAGVTASFEDGFEVLAVIEDDDINRNVTDPGIGVGIWTTADRFFERFSEKIADLFV